MNKISISFLMLMLISTSAVAKQSSFVDNSQSVTVQPSRSNDVRTPICLSLEKVDSQNQQLCGSTIVRNVTSITMK